MSTTIQKNVEKVFERAFGRTPLKQRLDDILSEAIELNRCVDIKKIKEELGDLLASAIMLANEADCNIEDLVNATLEKIDRRILQYKSLGRKKQVALFGGAFDPVTRGHINTAQFVLNTSKTFDEVWFMPCYKHMYGKRMATPKNRIKMCELGTNVDKRLKVFPYEIQNKLLGETYQTVKLLQEDKLYQDNFNFSWVIGQDNANSFDKWVNYEHLEKLIRFVVVPRTGVDPAKGVDWYFKPPHIFLNREDMGEEISSTMVRNAIKKETPDEDLLKLIDPKVLEYIKANKLYLR